MENHIKKLINATINILVSYSLAFTVKGDPDIGVRKYEKYNNSDSVIIDDTVWLIAGDIYNKLSCEQITNIQTVHRMDISNIKVKLYAQAIVCGKIMTVDLGDYYVEERIIYNSQSGLLALEKERT